MNIHSENIEGETGIACTEMIALVTHDNHCYIRPIKSDELDAVLDVYRQCEDFLALGPVPTASMAMVLQDIEISHHEGGVFCGIYDAADDKMIGVVDYVPCGFEGDPHLAHLSLLMIAAPFRQQGVGRSIVEVIEQEIMKGAQVTTILSGVQVNNLQAIQFWQKQGYRIASGPTLMPDQTTVFELRKDVNH
jgi:ribosomal protein S18 acetylase RimI-like enzyme